MSSPSLSVPLRLTAILSLAIIAGVAKLHAQDRLTFQDNHVQDGKITGMNGNTVLLNVATSTGTGQVGYDQGLIKSIDSPTPPAFQAGYAAYAAGQWEKALASLKPLVATYRGLRTDWAQQATGYLGDVYVEKNDLTDAEAAYNDYRRLYPGAANTPRATLGQARIAFARNNAAAARQGLEPIKQAAMMNPASVTQLDGSAYGQAFYLSGQLNEREGKYQAALEDYLRTVTLFYQDAGVTGRAQKSADVLRAAHKDVSVP